MRQQIKRSVERNTKLNGNPRRRRGGPSLRNTPLALSIDQAVAKRLEERRRREEAEDGPT